MSVKNIVDSLSLEQFTNKKVTLGIRRYFESTKSDSINESITNDIPKSKLYHKIKFTSQASNFKESIAPALRAGNYIDDYNTSASSKLKLFSVCLVIESASKAKECFLGLKNNSSIIPYTNIRSVIDVGIKSYSKDEALSLLSNAMRECNCPYYTVQQII